jgi:hypothetical protein
MRSLIDARCTALALFLNPHDSFDNTTSYEPDVLHVECHTVACFVAGVVAQHHIGFFFIREAESAQNLYNMMTPVDHKCAQIHQCSEINMTHFYSVY